MAGLLDLLQSNYSTTGANPQLYKNRAGSVVNTDDIFTGAMSALANILGGAARGSVTSAMGLPGDINKAIVNNIGSAFPNAPAYPTTEQWQQLLPGAPTTGEGKIAQTLGQFIPLSPGVGKLAGQAINDAMVYGAGPLAKITPQPMRIFAGENSNTWNKMLGDAAKMMEEDGKSPEEIHKVTGTFKGADNKWRQELSDKNAVVNFPPNDMDILDLHSQLIHGKKYGYLPFGENGLGDAREAVIKSAQPEIDRFKTVGGVLKNSQLLDAYPDLAKIKLNINKTPDISGNYQKSIIEDVGPKNSVKKKIGGEEINLNVPDEDTLKSALLHELQHAIQTREEFARGGSPSEFKDVAKDIKYHQDQFDQNLKQRMTTQDPIAKDNAIQAMTFHGLKLGELKQKYGTNDKEFYNRLAGEAEARATQARRNMTPEEQRAKFPLLSYDVDPTKLIVRY